MLELAGTCKTRAAAEGGTEGFNVLWAMGRARHSELGCALVLNWIAAPTLRRSHRGVPRLKSFAKYWLPVLLWMALIFGGATGALSAQRTSRVIGPLLRWLKPDVSEETIRAVQFCIRKTGHVSVYAVLAWLFWRARRRPLPADARPWDWRMAAEAALFASLYAVTDEWHQSFVPSREGSVWDVLLDAAGAWLGLVVLWRAGLRRGWWPAATSMKAE